LSNIRPLNEKITGLVRKFTHKLSDIEHDLNLISELCETYLVRLKETPSAYKELYTRILYQLQGYKRDTYLISEIYEILLFHTRMCESKDLSDYIALAGKYVDKIAEEIEVPANYLFFTTLRDCYSSLSIHVTKTHITMLPLSDLYNPAKWILLSHEFGHLYFQTHKNDILVETLPLIEEKLRETLVEKSSRLEKIKENKELWSEFWLEELVSDIIGVSLGGPAYLKMLILETCDYNPVAMHDIAHPPLDARAFTQIRYLEHVGAPSELVSRIKEEWKAFRNGISEESPLQEAFNEDLLNAIAQKLTEFIPHPFIVTKWNHIKRIISKIPKVKEDIRLVIPAVALAEVRVKPLDIIKAVR